MEIKGKEKHLKLLRNYGAWLKSSKKNRFKNQTSKADISNWDKSGHFYFALTG
jgi:hypothetical protein